MEIEYVSEDVYFIRRFLDSVLEAKEKYHLKCQDNL